MSAGSDILIGLLGPVSKDDLALKLSGEVGAEFRMRESSMRGGLYFTTKRPGQPVGSEEITVFSNLAPLGGPDYPEAQDCPVLVEFRNTSRAAADALVLVARIAGLSCRIVQS